MSADRFPNLYIRLLWKQRHWGPEFRKALRDWIAVAKQNRTHPKWERTHYGWRMTTAALTAESALKRTTPEFCGDEQPHEAHEFLHGARRFDCAGCLPVTQEEGR